MWEFIKFLLESVLEGREVGDHAFAFIEGVCFLVAAGVLWHRKHAVHEAWEKWEKRIMKAAFGIFLCVFLGSSLFYVPFIHHKNSEHTIENLTRNLGSTSNELLTVRAELKVSEAARLRRLEDGKSGQPNANVITEMK